MTRRRVSIRIEQLLEVHQRREPAFFLDFRCRLCPFAAHAVDNTSALDEFAHHLAQAHRASGGHRRTP